MITSREYGSIEAYLERLRALLAGMPEDEIDETLEEMGQHLQTLVEAGTGSGMGYADAVRRAIARFGEPEVIASKELLGYLGRLSRNGQFPARQSWKRTALRAARYALAGAIAIAFLLTFWSATEFNLLIIQAVCTFIIAVLVGVTMGTIEMKRFNTAVRAFIASITDDQRRAILSYLRDGESSAMADLPPNPRVWDRLAGLRRQLFVQLGRRIAAESFSPAPRGDIQARLTQRALLYTLCMACFVGILSLISPSSRTQDALQALLILPIFVSYWIAQQIVEARDAKRSLAE